MISEMSIEKSVEELKGLLSRGKELVIQVYPFTSKPQELGSKLAELNKWMEELNQRIDSIKSLHKDFERVDNPLQASGKTLVLRTSSEDLEMELESISKGIQFLENLSKIENWTEISSPKDLTELRDDSFVMNKSEDHDINDEIVNFNDGSHGNEDAKRVESHHISESKVVRQEVSRTIPVRNSEPDVINLDSSSVGTSKRDCN